MERSGESTISTETAGEGIQTSSRRDWNWYIGSPNTGTMVLMVELHIAEMSWELICHVGLVNNVVIACSIENIDPTGVRKLEITICKKRRVLSLRLKNPMNFSDRKLEDESVANSDKGKVMLQNR
jgi:hypothetical protein